MGCSSEPAGQCLCHLQQIPRAFPANISSRGSSESIPSSHWSAPRQSQQQTQVKKDCSFSRRKELCKPFPWTPFQQDMRYIANYSAFIPQKIRNGILMVQKPTELFLFCIHGTNRMVASCIIDFIPSTGSWNALGTLEIISFKLPPLAQQRENFMELSQEKQKRKRQKFSDPKQLHWKKGSILKGHRVGRMISTEFQFNLFSLSVVYFHSSYLEPQTFQ